MCALVYHRERERVRELETEFSKTSNLDYVRITLQDTKELV